MPRRLIVIRHAKSDWDAEVDSDHARVLNPRGRRACDAIGGWLEGHGYLPDQVLCSDAARTLETWQRLSAHLPKPPAPQLSDTLYLASADALLAAVKAAEGACVAVIAHNPGIAAFASGMVAAAPTHDRFRAYPTLSTLVIDFNVATWSDVTPGSGNAVDFIVPRDLTG